MNKKLLVITIVALIVALATIITVFYLQTFKTVHFEVKPTDLGTVTIYNKANKEVAQFENNTDVRLQPGDYTVGVTAKKYNQTPYRFKLSEDMTVTVNPSYSAEYRDSILTKELPAINQVITSTYASVIAGFTINKGEVYQDGKWYATTLTQKPATTTEQGDIYRLILEKHDSTWTIRAKPTLVISAKEYPEIPVEILRSINMKSDDAS